MMETLITALRAGRPEHTPEAEMVLVAVDGATVTLTLDDGETLVFDAAELAAAQGFTRRRRQEAA
jgi:hypothetical protein